MDIFLCDCDCCSLLLSVWVCGFSHASSLGSVAEFCRKRPCFKKKKQVWVWQIWVFSNSLRNWLPVLQCVFSSQLVCVCVCVPVVTWVFLCSGACMNLCPAMDHGGQTREIFNNVCCAFSTKTFDKHNLEVHKSSTCVWSPLVHGLHSSVCVSLRVLDACRTAGIQNCLLNYICTKTTGLCTRRAPLPASQRVSQQPDAARSHAAHPVYFPPVFVCVSRFSRVKLWPKC